MGASAMNWFARRYEQLKWELLTGRGLGVLSEENEDRILEKMDECWWKMPQVERDEAERLAAEAAKIEGPDDVRLVDVEVPLRSAWFPRKVA